MGIKMTNVNLPTGKFTIGITNVPPLWVTSSNLGSFESDKPVNIQLVAIDIGNTLTYTLISGDLPDSLTLSSSGLISGTLLEMGNFQFTVRVSDGDLSTDRQFTIIGTPPIDPYFNNVVLLMNGLDFMDHSPTPISITNSGVSLVSGRNGTAYDITGGDVMTFNSNPVKNWFESDYTVEYWACYYNPASITDFNAIGLMTPSSTARYWSIGARSSTNLTFYYLTTVANHVNGTVNIQPNVWNHYAMSFDKANSTIRVFFNGNQIASTTSISGTPDTSGSPMSIGKVNDIGFGGAIDDIRITKACRYTGNFTPPNNLPTIGPA